MIQEQQVEPGQIIILNGSPSAGKTSIAKAIQATFEQPFLLMGGDIALLEVFPGRYKGSGEQADQGFYFEGLTGAEPPEMMFKQGSYGRKFFSDWRSCQALLARMGHNLIVDEAFHADSDPEEVRDIATRLRGLPVLLVGVQCPFEVVLERIRSRSDRSYEAWPRWSFRHVHSHGSYDLELDTSTFSPEECARRIQTHLETGAPQTAFRQLTERFG